MGLHGFWCLVEIEIEAIGYGKPVEVSETFENVENSKFENSEEKVEMAKWRNAKIVRWWFVRSFVRSFVGSFVGSFVRSFVRFCFRSFFVPFRSPIRSGMPLPSVALLVFFLRRSDSF